VLSSSLDVSGNNVSDWGIENVSHVLNNGGIDLLLSLFGHSSEHGINVIFNDKSGVEE